MVVFFQKLAPTVIAIEACGASHHLARLLQSFGHTVKLIAPQLVKPYVKRGKNDAADAEALCEAMSRPTMRFVPVKTAEQQAASVLVGRQAHLDALAFRFGAGASVAEREQKLAGLRATARDSWFATPVRPQHAEPLRRLAEGVAYSGLAKTARRQQQRQQGRAQPASVEPLPKHGVGDKLHATRQPTAS